MSMKKSKEVEGKGNAKQGLHCEKCGKKVEHAIANGKTEGKLLCETCLSLNGNNSKLQKTERLQPANYLIRAIKLTGEQFNQLGTIAKAESKTRYVLYNEAIQMFIDNRVKMV